MKKDGKTNTTFENFEVKLTYIRDVFYQIKLPNKLSQSERLNLIKVHLNQLSNEEFSSHAEYDYDLPSEIQICLSEDQIDDCYLLEIKLDSNSQYQLFYDDEIVG